MGSPPIPSPMTESKSRRYLEIKSAGEEGTFEGILSTYGNIDSVGDVCESHCFDKTVAIRGKTRPLLWQHNPDEPIGQMEIVGTESALTIKARINREVGRGREAYALLKSGDISGLSIGYSVDEYEYDSDGIRHLLSVDLYEGSVVTFPANEKAVVTSVKSKQSEDETMKLTELRSWGLLDPFQKKMILEELKSRKSKKEEEEEEAKEDEVPEDSEKSDCTEDEKSKKSENEESDLAEQLKALKAELDELTEKMKS